MNVIGIVQTGLNEFSVLFDQEHDGQDRGQNGENDGSQNESNDSMFFGILDEFMGQSDHRDYQGNGNRQNQGPQEMTVRIKGIPEGQKANFLQMYQILQDAQDMETLKQRLTIVSYGNGQNAKQRG